MCLVRTILIALMLTLPLAARAQQSVARQWDEEALAAIRIDLPRPPVHARNLFHLSVAMYDAWAAYDPTARGYLFTEKIATTNAAAERDEAISYAAFRVLLKRYKLSVSSTQSLAAVSNRMVTLGYDPSITNTVGDTPSAVGNRIAELVIAYGLGDGANESNNYRRTNGYNPTNEPLIVALPDQPLNLADPNRWQPLALDYAVTQNGFDAGKIQTNVCPHWGYVKPFALLRKDTNDIYENRGAPPRLGGPTDAQFKSEMLHVIQLSGELTPDDGVTVDISPGAYGNNSLGYNDGAGYPSNPVTGLPYTTNVVPRGDLARVLAEFWADGPSSETPPGHWNALANYVSDSTSTVKRIGGAGPVVSNLEWDVKLYFGLNGAVHDAAIAAWNHKGVHDSVRPITAIRFMGGLGQSSDPLQPSYHTNGLPLVTGLVEVITTNSAAPGERHEHLATNIGEIAILTWPGQPTNPATQHSGVKWIRSRAWLPYQKNTFVTPPFAGFMSGHSTFSRSAAEYLTHFTGSEYFPGGLGEYVASSNTYLTFERGPSADVRLQWATFYDAADQAGISRLWGGIHIDSDDREGRKTGAIIGKDAWQYAVQFFAGAAQPHPPYEIDMNISPTSGVVCSWPAVSGRTYRFQVTTNLLDFADVPGVYTATTWSVTLTNAAPASTMQVFRVITGD